uniref:Uncharacterized protein n=1 Tax=Heliothis virescens TaxID=7102 RepID=A0A2A4K1H4_HELVI
MASACCVCRDDHHGGHSADGKSNLPLICLVPRDDAHHTRQPGGSGRSRRGSSPTLENPEDFHLLDDEYIEKHFKLSKRPLYLDPFRRPLITFPMSQEGSSNFNLARKYKVNQQILDGFLDPSEAISAPSVFPYATSKTEKSNTKHDDEELIYILQLPDWEYTCPVHKQSVRTPRFIWHSCKKEQKTTKGNEPTHGGGPMNKPKPWLLSRHTDFDLMSQCPILRPGFDALNLSAPFIVQMNAEGKWENTRPANLDEERLKAVIQNLVNSNAISAAQSYCCQCAAENQFPKTQPQYIPVVMMPVYSADRCPFDMNCEVEKLREAEKGKVKKPSKKTKAEDDTKEEKDKDTIKRTKKRSIRRSPTLVFCCSLPFLCI